MAFFPVFPIQRCVKVYKPRRDNLTKDYRSLYRFEEENVEWLANHFLGENHETRGGALTSKQRMQIFLRYVADPGFQKGIGEKLGIDQSTVCKVVKQVRMAIIEKSHLWIKFPTTVAEILQAKDKFQTRFKIPCVIGLIYCTNIRITKPGGPDGDEYINRKRFASINVQATCDANEKFTSVVAEWPGSVHYSRILKTSDIFRFLKANTKDTALLGDSGYGIAPWLITPYENPRNDVELYFNAVYAKERVIIERCFGQLKRFPTLHYKVRVSLETVSRIIIACFVLHNIAKYLNEADDFDIQDEGNREQLDNNNEIERDDLIRARGQTFRKRVAETLFINR